MTRTRLRTRQQPAQQQAPAQPPPVPVVVPPAPVIIPPAPVIIPPAPVIIPPIQRNQTEQVQQQVTNHQTQQRANGQQQANQEQQQATSQPTQSSQVNQSSLKPIEHYTQQNRPPPIEEGYIPPMIPDWEGAVEHWDLGLIDYVLASANQPAPRTDRSERRIHGVNTHRREALFDEYASMHDWGKKSEKRMAKMVAKGKGIKAIESGFDSALNQISKLPGLGLLKRAISSKKKPEAVLVQRPQASSDNLDTLERQTAPSAHQEVEREVVDALRDEQRLDIIEHEAVDNKLSKIHVFVKPIAGKTIILDLKPSDTYGDLEFLIQDKTGVPAEESRLIVSGWTFGSGSSLRSFDNATVTQVLRLKGGARLKKITSLEDLKKLSGLQLVQYIEERLGGRNRVTNDSENENLIRALKRQINQAISKSARQREKWNDKLKEKAVELLDRMKSEQSASATRPQEAPSSSDQTSAQPAIPRQQIPGPSAQATTSGTQQFSSSRPTSGARQQRGALPMLPLAATGQDIVGRAIRLRNDNINAGLGPFAVLPFGVDNQRGGLEVDEMQHYLRTIRNAFAWVRNNQIDHALEVLMQTYRARGIPVQALPTMTLEQLGEIANDPRENALLTNLSDEGILLVPVHVGTNHFVLVAVDLANGEMDYLDSLLSYRRTYGRTVLALTRHILYERFHREFDGYINDTALIQNNGVECGNMVPVHADLFLNGVRDFGGRVLTIEQMRPVRRQIMIHALNGQVIGRPDNAPILDIPSLADLWQTQQPLQQELLLPPNRLRVDEQGRLENIVELQNLRARNAELQRQFQLQRQQQAPIVAPRPEDSAEQVQQAIRDTVSRRQQQNLPTIEEEPMDTSEAGVAPTNNYAREIEDAIQQLEKLGLTEVKEDQAVEEQIAPQQLEDLTLALAFGAMQIDDETGAVKFNSNAVNEGEQAKVNEEEQEETAANEEEQAETEAPVSRIPSLYEDRKQFYEELAADRGMTADQLNDQIARTDELLHNSAMLDRLLLVGGEQHQLRDLIRTLPENDFATFFATSVGDHVMSFFDHLTMSNAQGIEEVNRVLLEPNVRRQNIRNDHENFGHFTRDQVERINEAYRALPGIHRGHAPAARNAQATYEAQRDVAALSAVRPERWHFNVSTNLWFENFARFRASLDGVATTFNLIGTLPYGRRTELADGLILCEDLYRVHLIFNNDGTVQTYSWILENRNSGPATFYRPTTIEEIERELGHPLITDTLRNNLRTHHGQVTEISALDHVLFEAARDHQRVRMAGEVANIQFRYNQICNCDQCDGGVQSGFFFVPEGARPRCIGSVHRELAKKMEADPDFEERMRKIREGHGCKRLRQLNCIGCGAPCRTSRTTSGGFVGPKDEWGKHAICNRHLAALNEGRLPLDGQTLNRTSGLADIISAIKEYDARQEEEHERTKLCDMSCIGCGESCYTRASCYIGPKDEWGKHAICGRHGSALDKGRLPLDGRTLNRASGLADIISAIEEYDARQAKKHKLRKLKELKCILCKAPCQTTKTSYGGFVGQRGKEDGHAVCSSHAKKISRKELKWKGTTLTMKSDPKQIRAAFKGCDQTQDTPDITPHASDSDNSHASDTNNSSDLD